MGIRMLNRRTAWALAQADADAAPSTPPPRVPVFAAAASTARIPADLPAELRGAAARLRHRFRDREQAAVPPGHRPDWRLWTDLARSYLALVLSRLPRSRPPVQTVTVFIATASTVSGRPDGSGSAPEPPGTRATP